MIVSIPFADPEARCRLVVFPHAGSGTAYYYFLAKALAGSGVEVVTVAYPGREIRISEPPAETMEELLDGLDPALERLFSNETPLVFYGHSLGALVAFEMIRRRQAAGLRLPLLLLCSGRQAPGVRGDIINVEGLSDDAFLREVSVRYQAIAPELLKHPDLLELILPALRCDFGIVYRYVYRAGERLKCPVALANGYEDPWVDEAALAGWADETEVVNSRFFPGGHFFMKDNLPEFRQYLLDLCQRTDVSRRHGC